MHHFFLDPDAQSWLCNLHALTLVSKVAVIGLSISGLRKEEAQTRQRT